MVELSDLGKKKKIKISIKYILLKSVTALVNQVQILILKVWSFLLWLNSAYIQKNQEKSIQISVIRLK